MASRHPKRNASVASIVGSGSLFSNKYHPAVLSTRELRLVDQLENAGLGAATLLKGCCGCL